MATTAPDEGGKRPPGDEAGRALRLVTSGPQEGPMQRAGALEADLAEDLEGCFERAVRDMLELMRQPD